MLSMPQQEPVELLTDLLTEETLRNALKNWHGKDLTYTPFDPLYIYRQLFRALERPTHFVTNMLLLQAFDEMETMYPEGVAFLKRRYWDDRSIDELAHELNISVNTVHNRQRKAIEQLQTTLVAMEERVRREQLVRINLRLGPKSNETLVGIADHMQLLAAQLRTDDSPWIIALEGLGGIGKTTLAHAVVDHLLDAQAFDEVGWVSAKQEYLEHGGAIKALDRPALTAEEMMERLARQLLPELTYHRVEQEPRLLTTALHTRLKQFPHLIVIDNLETVTDLQALLPTIQTLANPTKFLLTSREGLHTQPNVYHFVVPELNADAALALLRAEIAGSHLTALATWPDAALLPIYAVVGGNPLALRLVVAQAHFHDLSTILTHLRHATNRASENLYTYIYLHAWQRLSEVEQDLLLVMALVNPEGDALGVIAEIAEVAESTVAEGLNQLVRLSLVDVRGDGHHRCYSIHGLTRTFLHEQVLRW